MNLLSYDAFKKFDSPTALSIIDAASPKSSSSAKTITPDELNSLLSPFDLKRLESYAGGMVDYHVILDLVPTLSSLFFSRRLGECTLSAAQQAILLALGLQRKPIEALETELGLTSSQTLALFGKIIRRILGYLQDVRKAGVGEDLPREQPQLELRNGVLDRGTGEAGFKPVEETVEEELGEEARRARAVQRELLDSMDMSQSVDVTAGDLTIS
jgi:N-acetyltransferase 10